MARGKSHAVSFSVTGKDLSSTAAGELAGDETDRYSGRTGSGVSRIHIICPGIMFKDKKGKNITGAVKGVNQHKGSDVDPPFSLELSLKGITHFRPVSQETETLFYIIICWPVKVT